MKKIIIMGEKATFTSNVMMWPIFSKGGPLFMTLQGFYAAFPFYACIINVDFLVQASYAEGIAEQGTDLGIFCMPRTQPYLLLNHLPGYFLLNLT